MKNKREEGFLTVIALLVSTLVSILLVYLLYISQTGSLVINSNRNDIQAYYILEGKFLKIFTYDKYYNDEILARAKLYVRTGRTLPYDPFFMIDEEDLEEGDTLRGVEISYETVENRRVMDIRIKTNFANHGISMKTRLHMVNKFYELGLPLLYKDLLKEDLRGEYIEYMDSLEREIGVDLDENPAGLEAMEIIDYDRVVIVRDTDNNYYLEAYRNNLEQYIIRTLFPKDKFFLAIRNGAKLEIIDQMEEGSKGDLLLKGVIYTEGDIFIEGNLDFRGIMILNQGKLALGEKNFSGEKSKLKIEGICLARDYPFFSREDEAATKLKYGPAYITDYGINLPGLINIEIIFSKIYSN